MSNFTIDIEKQLSRLGKDIQQFVENVTHASHSKGDFYPVCDISESNDNYRIQMDLPGMKKEHVEIKLESGVLSISGERELYLEDDEELKRSERRQGSFVRSFALPENVDPKTISATFNDGVLQIAMKKLGVDDEESSQSIPIE